jgi:siroheme synthase
VYPAGPQAGINHLLIDEARAGQTVVRLTNGDPFLFERGGEEAEALVEAAITFEAVPGGARAASAVAPVPPSGRSGADGNAPARSAALGRGPARHHRCW